MPEAFMRALRRLAYWFRARSRQSDLEDELAVHRELVERDLRARGMTAADARDAARRTMGNETYVREESRGIWITPWLENAWKDLQYAGRGLRRSPGFTLVAVLSLGVGIGANTAIFSLIHAVLLARLPVPEAERLFEPRRLLSPKGVDDRFSRAEADAVNGGPLDLAVFTSTSASVIVDASEDGEGLDAVDGRYFDMLGVRAVRGRVISAFDDDAAAPVVVVSDRFWRGRLGADSAALGRVITIQRQPFTVVGILRPGFNGVRFPSTMDITIPYRAARASGIVQSDDSRNQFVTIVGRLRDGQSLDQAGRAFALVWSRCCAAGQFAAPTKPGTAPAQLEVVDVSRGIPQLKLDVRGQYSRVLFALMGGVAILLLIACANVGNLLLARAASREREIAVRLALGASRGRLLSQLVIESVLLSTLGALLGVLIATWATSLLIRAELDALSSVLTTRPDPAVLAFTAAVSVACGVIFGIVPAVCALRTDLVTPLKEGRRRPRGAHRHVVDRGIVAVQMALALLLVSAAALLIQTLQNLQGVDVSVDAAHLVAATVETRGTVYERQKMTVRMADDILQRVRAIPGIRFAGLTSCAPIIGGRGAFDDIIVPGYTAADEDDKRAAVVGVTPGYFAAAGIPIRVGRDLIPQDGSSGRRGAVVNEEFARKFFAGRAAMGQTFHDGDASGSDRQIVGIVPNVKYFDLRTPPGPMIYVPVADGDWPFLVLVARIAGDPATVQARISRAIAAVAPGAVQRGMTTMESAIDAALSRERITATLAGLFGAIALGLAAVGLYGVMVYQVAGRTAEIGIRMALGARRSTVLWLVLRQSLAVIGIGLVAGIPLALLAGRSVASQLYGVTPYSFAALGGACAVLVGVGVVASLLPARRAMAVDPLTALRMD